MSQLRRIVEHIRDLHGRHLPENITWQWVEKTIHSDVDLYSLVLHEIGEIPAEPDQRRGLMIRITALLRGALDQMNEGGA